MLQNRTLPPDLGGTRVVYSWDLEHPEMYCVADDIAFTDSAHRVIVDGTERCALHASYDHPCLTAGRMPPECPHERIDPQAPPETPRCMTCGRVGVDVTGRYLRGPFAALPGPAPDEVLGEESILLGEPGTPEAS